MTVLASNPGLSLRSRLARRLPRVGGPRITRHRLAVAAVLALSLAFYMWTAASTTPFVLTTHQGADIYNLQTTGFLHGHTYLPITPPAGLLRLRDPYDPAQNAPYQAAYHDLALRHGHLYAPWGPTPAITLFLLPRIVGLEIGESLAVALFCFFGLVCAVALLHVLVRRFVPAAPDWLLSVGSLGIALSNVAPFLLRRPSQYEAAISAGYCFEMLGLLLVATAALASRPRLRRLALGSFCLGLAVGGRPTLAVGGLAAVAAAIYFVRAGRRRVGVVSAALVPLVVCGLLLAAYNDVRFGSPTEFGQRYQLAGYDQTKIPAVQLAYLPPGAFTYLFVPERLALTFPHVFLMNDTEYPGKLPAVYTGAPGASPAEPTGGLVPMAPITLVLVALPVLWWRRRDDERGPLLIASGLTVVAAGVVVLLSIALWGTTERYAADFTTLALLAAFLVWATLLTHLRSRAFARRAVAVGGIALTAFGAAAGTAVSFTGYYDLLRVGHPRLFRTLEDATSPFATLATMIVGRPVLVRVDDGSTAVDLPALRYGNYGERGASTWVGDGPVTVTVLSPGTRQVALEARAALGPAEPPGTHVSLKVRSSGESRVVPLVDGVLRLPIRLHWGLNRIPITVVGGALNPYDVRLAGLSLTR